MSVHTDDGGVSVAPMNSSVAEVFGGDEHFELIEGAADISVLCWPNNFVVSSTKSYVSWVQLSNFTSGS